MFFLQKVFYKKIMLKGLNVKEVHDLIQETLTKADTCGTSKTCPSKRGVRFMEVPIKRELTVFKTLT